VKVGDKPVGFRKKFLHVVKPGPARSARAQVILNLFDFGEL
jgi:hypothetical protein